MKETVLTVSTAPPRFLKFLTIYGNFLREKPFWQLLTAPPSASDSMLTSVGFLMISSLWKTKPSCLPSLMFMRGGSRNGLTIFSSTQPEMRRANGVNNMSLGKNLNICFSFKAEICSDGYVPHLLWLGDLWPNQEGHEDDDGDNGGVILYYIGYMWHIYENFSLFQVQAGDGDQ